MDKNFAISEHYDYKRNASQFYSPCDLDVYEHEPSIIPLPPNYFSMDFLYATSWAAKKKALKANSELAHLNKEEDVANAIGLKAVHDELSKGPGRGRVFDYE